MKDGEVIAGIMYSKARVADGEVTHDLLTFGPLSVLPKWQGRGIGELLLKETMSLAREAGSRESLSGGTRLLSENRLSKPVTDSVSPQ
ncbi:MAG: GNAT family N-acetyltransferase [Alkalibacterium sp.]|nr:GNAT family N-acetyltransferase [Alkalibacterium sp.]